METKAAMKKIEEVKNQVLETNQKLETNTDTFLTKLVNKPWSFWAVFGMALALTIAGALALG